LTMDLQRFVADLHDHHNLLVEEIEFLEKGNQIRMIGEAPEVSTARFLATLRKHKADLDELISQCETMRVGPVP